MAIAPKNIPDIATLISDRELFKSFVYTPLWEAVEELKKRWEDGKNHLPKSIPRNVENGFNAIYSVCTVTPNYEVMRFMWASDAFGLKPVIFERKYDKFVPQNNPWKYSLGRVGVHEKADKNGKAIIKFKSIVDFNKYSGKPISEVKTLWDQPIVDFHHELFLSRFPSFQESENIFDNSEWFIEVGGTTRAYYDALLSLTIRHGILFDNFLLDRKEGAFTRDVFLPAFLDVYKNSGMKPLIVALEPNDLEGDVFWLSHPPAAEQIISERLRLGNG